MRRRLGPPSYGATADRAAAAVALDRGDAAAAAQLALRAADASERIGEVVRAAEASVLAGKALAAAGDGDTALEVLSRAAATYALADAPRRRDEVEYELRRLGHRRLHHRSRPGAAGADGFESLTERELQVPGWSWIAGPTARSHPPGS